MLRDRPAQALRCHHTLEASGTVVRTTNLPAERRALTADIGTFPGPHRAVVECTGMWYWVRDLLAPQGIDLRLGHAKYLKAISYAKVKSDAVDAATLAQLVRPENPGRGTEGCFPSLRWVRALTRRPSTDALIELRALDSPLRTHCPEAFHLSSSFTSSWIGKMENATSRPSLKLPGWMVASQ